ncbi:alpha/beta-hydrolase [Ophiobolus disseminans]|uniref:Alpha/beta-hydrolase n=1 Tax=Ophiobolus disseminans TaxID=1469910 RepID=A0A6A6ZDY4_9PLEO|nr:alpha/beta-hydrolase [Ophiobolus disseminans]
MALDFSQYGGKSDDWIALEKTLPALTFDTSMDPLALQSAVNTERANRSAAVFAELSAHVHTKDYSIPTRDGSTIEARTYRSVKTKEAEKLPVYLYFHGGGFIFGSIGAEDAACANTAIKTGVIVLNVNYRHTPQHIFPTAWNDSEDAFAWLHKNIDEVGGDASKVIVGGVSAGSQLSASLMLEQHLKKSDVTKDLPTLAGQILIIPCLADNKTYDQGPGKKLKVSSYVENEYAPVLPKTVVEFFTGLLKVDKIDLKDTKINIVNVSEDEVKGLPPTVFGIAGLDPLRDEGLLYAKMLSEANVPTDVTLFKGVPHGHRRFGDALRESKYWDDCIEEGIRWVLSRPQATGRFEVKVPSS